jgi:hypothetical protein
MARRPSRKGKIVRVDFTGVESGGGGGVKIPEGSYRMKVAKVEEDESSAGNDMFKWTFKGVEGKAKGKTFYQYTTLNDEALWKLRSLLEALDVEVPDGPLDIDLEDMIDRELIGIVQDDTYKGKTSSKMMDFESPDGAGEEEEQEEEEETTSRSRRKKPAEEEEEEATPRRGRKKPAAEEEEEEVEETRPRRGGKKTKPEPIAGDEVRAMEEEELEEVIEKYKLEVDLSKFKTPSRKSSAVIAALEEAEMLAD